METKVSKIFNPVINTYYEEKDNQQYLSLNFDSYILDTRNGQEQLMNVSIPKMIFDNVNFEFNEGTKLLLPQLTILPDAKSNGYYTFTIEEKEEIITMRLWEILKDLDENKIVKDTKFISNDLDKEEILFDGSALKRKSFPLMSESRSISNLSDRDFRRVEPVKTHVIYKKKDIQIRNYVGEFKEEFIDSVTILYNDTETYKTIPLNNKIGIPYVKNGIVTILYSCNVKVK